jgi:hypothetical protein
MDTTKFIIQMILGGTAILTVGFLAFETRKVAQAAAVRAMRELASSLAAVNSIFVEKPELRPYFYSDAPLPDNSQTRDQVEAMVELVSDYLETSLYTEEHLPTFRRENRKDLRTWIEFLDGHSPAFREGVMNNPGEWWPRLREAVTKIREDD